MELPQLGLRVRIQGMGGTIARQEPEAGAQVFYGNTVTLELSQQTESGTATTPAETTAAASP